MFTAPRCALHEHVMRSVVDRSAVGVAHVKQRAARAVGQGYFKISRREIESNAAPFEI